MQGAGRGASKTNVTEAGRPVTAGQTAGTIAFSHLGKYQHSSPSTAGPVQTELQCRGNAATGL